MTNEQPQRVAILGQGYVGLPVSLRAVDAGFHVIGFDIDEGRVQRLRNASTFIDDVSDDDLARAMATGRFHPTSATDDLAGFDIAVISVPTPLFDGTPDLTYIESAADLLAPHVTRGCCVVLESTTYPGTTEEILVPRLEAGSSLRSGADFHVGYSPERIDPGNSVWTFEKTPKIVAGIDEDSFKVVDRFYSALVERTVPVPGVKEAELAKLLENTFRHVNIALVNELAIYAHELGIDVWSVIEAAATKPFGFMRFTPGPGVGGHCLPIDPSYLSWQVRRSLGHSFRFVELANDVNDHMPDYVVRRVARRLNDDRKAVNGARILLLGVSYKANSGDARESPAISVANGLRALGAELFATDPLVEPRFLPHHITLVPCNVEQLDAADLVVVLTDHRAFDWTLVESYAHKVLDTRNRLASALADRL